MEYKAALGLLLWVDKQLINDLCGKFIMVAAF